MESSTSARSSGFFMCTTTVFLDSSIVAALTSSFAVTDTSSFSSETTSSASASTTVTYHVTLEPSSATISSFCGLDQLFTESGIGEMDAPSDTLHEATDAFPTSEPFFSRTTIVSPFLFDFNSSLKIISKAFSLLGRVDTSTYQVFDAPLSEVTTNF